jgi:hypothetical protein
MVRCRTSKHVRLSSESPVLIPDIDIPTPTTSTADSVITTPNMQTTQPSSQLALPRSLIQSTAAPMRTATACKENNCAATAASAVTTRSGRQEIRQARYRWWKISAKLMTTTFCGFWLTFCKCAWPVTISTEHVHFLYSCIVDIVNIALNHCLTLTPLNSWRVFYCTPWPRHTALWTVGHSDILHILILLYII